MTITSSPFTYCRNGILDFGEWGVVLVSRRHDFKFVASYGLSLIGFIGLRGSPESTLRPQSKDSFVFRFAY
jgi:hypothetical protein